MDTDLPPVPPSTEGVDAPRVPPAPPVPARLPATKTKTLTNKQRLLVQMGLPMLERLVAEFARRYRDVAEEDFLGAGAIALHEAAITFEEGKSASFLHYARCRVRGGLADAVAEGQSALGVRVEHMMERAFGGFSAHLMLDVDLYSRSPEELTEGMRKGAAAALAASFVAALLEGREASPEEEMSQLEGRRDGLAALEKAMAALDPNERKVIRMVYWEEKQLKGIAKELGVHENTPQNWHRSAMGKLRRALVGREL